MKKLITLIALIPTLLFAQTPNMRQVASAGTTTTRLPAASTTTVLTTDTIMIFTGGVWKKIKASQFTPVATPSWYLTGNAGTVDGTNFIGTTDNQSFSVRTNNSRRMKIDSLGNFIFGTSSQLLSTNVADFYKNQDGATSLFVRNNTNGTSAFSGIAASANEANTVLMAIYSASFTPTGLQIPSSASVSTDATDGMNLGTTSNTKLDFWTNNTQKMRLSSGGLLGIGTGTTTPSATLHAIGSGSTSATYAAKFENSVSSEIFKIYNSGQFLAGSVATGNLFFGNTSGLTNSGTINTSFGVRAMEDITSGGSNSAFGYLALTNITQGLANSAFGSNALLSVTTGGNNCAFGINSLYANTANYNSAFGYYTLAANITGAINSAFGTQALRDNVDGIDNSALGYNAFRYNTNGDYGVAVGGQACMQNLTGNNNTGVGFQAGYSNTSGSNNLYLGYYSGYYQNGITGKIYIGSRNYTTLNNENTRTPIIVQSHATDSSQTSIWLQGKAGILTGTVVPTAALTVKSGFVMWTGAVTTYTATTSSYTVTSAELARGTLRVAGTGTVTLTLPTATLLGTQLGWVANTSSVFPFTVLNESTGVVTLVVGTGITVSTYPTVTDANELIVPIDATGTGVGVFQIASFNTTTANIKRIQ